MVRYPARIAQDILIKIRGYFVLVDFVVLEMETSKELSVFRTNTGE